MSKYERGKHEGKPSTAEKCAGKGYNMNSSGRNIDVMEKFIQ